MLTNDLHQLILNGARKWAKHRDSTYVNVWDIRFYWSLIPELFSYDPNDYLIMFMLGDRSNRVEYINYPDELSEKRVIDQYQKMLNRFKPVIHKFFNIYERVGIRMKDLFIFEEWWGFQEVATCNENGIGILHNICNFTIKWKSRYRKWRDRLMNLLIYLEKNRKKLNFEEAYEHKLMFIESWMKLHLLKEFPRSYERINNYLPDFPKY